MAVARFPSKSALHLKKVCYKVSLKTTVSNKVVRHSLAYLIMQKWLVVDITLPEILAETEPALQKCLFPKDWLICDELTAIHPSAYAIVFSSVVFHFQFSIDTISQSRHLIYVFEPSLVQKCQQYGKYPTGFKCWFSTRRNRQVTEMLLKHSTSQEVF